MPAVAKIIEMTATEITIIVPEGRSILVDGNEVAAENWTTTHPLKNLAAFEALLTEAELTRVLAHIHDRKGI